MQRILDYFPQLTPHQRTQLEQLDPLYREWNERINVISRKDIDQLYEHHVLHSLSIARLVRFAPGAEVLDLGTGGGFPGIPLAILFPETNFWLVDGRGKKIKVVQAVAEALELQNVRALHSRAEELKHHFDFVLSRAVARLDKLVNWTGRVLKKKQPHGRPHGLIALKGGRVIEEIEDLHNRHYTEIYPLSDFFTESYFTEKYIVYVQG